MREKGRTSIRKLGDLREAVAWSVEAVMKIEKVNTLRIYLRDPR